MTGTDMENGRQEAGSIPGLLPAVDGYLRSRLDPLGLTEAWNTFSIGIGQEQELEYFSHDAAGNILINFPSASTRLLQQYPLAKGTMVRLVPVVRIRYGPATIKFDKDGDRIKYQNPAGCPSPLFIPKGMLQRIRAKEQLDTLYVTEGEFKAAAADRHGLPVVGVAGIYNVTLSGPKRHKKDGSEDKLAKPREFISELLEVLRICSVKRLVFIYDSDLFDLGRPAPGTDPRHRSNNFHQAAAMFSACCEACGLQPWIAWPRPPEDGGKLGLDDLILKVAGEAPEVLAKLEDGEDMANPMAVHWWEDGQWAASDRVQRFAGAMGWAAMHIWDPPTDWPAMPMIRKMDAQIQLTALAPAVRWVATGRRVVRDLMRICKGPSGQPGQWFEARQIPYGAANLRSLWGLESPVTFYRMHRAAMQGWDCFKWGARDTYDIINGEPVLHEQEIQIRLEESGNQVRLRTDLGLKVVAGFTMRGRWHIQRPDGSKNTLVLFDIATPSGHKYQVVLDTETFGSLQAFKVRMLDFGLIWKGNMEQHTAFIENSLVEATSATMVDVLGWNADHNLFFWANGAYDATAQSFIEATEEGFLVAGERQWFLPPASRIPQFSGGQEQARLMRHEHAGTPTTWSKWWDAAATVFGPEKAAVGAMYVAATAVSDLVRERKWFFPLLFLFGPPQMGKTTFARNLQAFWGRPQSPVNMESGATTLAGIQRTLAAARNVPCFFDEASARTRPELMDMMKNAYDGTSGTQGRATNGNERTTYKVNGTAILAAQHLPGHDAAMPSRCIFLEFPRRPAPNMAERYAMDFLEGMAVAGLTHLVNSVVGMRAKIEEQWSMTFARIYKFLLEHAPDGVSDRVLQTHAALATPLCCIAQQIEGGKLFNETALSAIMLDLLPLHQEASKAADDMEAWWILLRSAATEFKIREGTHFTIDAERPVVFLQFSLCYGIYAQQANIQKTMSPLPFGSMKKYLERSPAYLKADSITKRRLSPNANPTSVMAFDLTMIDFIDLDTK